LLSFGLFANGVCVCVLICGTFRIFPLRCDCELHARIPCTSASIVRDSTKIRSKDIFQPQPSARSKSTILTMEPELTSPPIQPPPSEPVAPHHHPPAPPSESLPAVSTSVSPRTTLTPAGRGSDGRGRTSTSGRGLISTGRRDGRGGGGGTHHQHHHHPASTTYGQPAQEQQRAVPVTIHASSGVPFGHVPSYLPGSSSLVEELDRRVLLVLRDGKHLIGVRKNVV
jgi:hypothetical protein